MLILTKAPMLSPMEMCRILGCQRPAIDRPMVVAIDDPLDGQLREVEVPVCEPHYRMVLAPMEPRSYSVA